jgi:hypothetical protein
LCGLEDRAHLVLQAADVTGREVVTPLTTKIGSVAVITHEQLRRS